jgi:hypothetical protein
MLRNYSELSLIDFQKYFSDDESRDKHLAEQRWPDGFAFPKCGIRAPSTCRNGAFSIVRIAAITRVSRLA